jgi:phosphoribosylaminoimidazole-succinocarboxamide synthase
MELTADIVPINCNPDPNVAVGHLCDPFKEMVIRGYLSGHAAREYASGKKNYLWSCYVLKV